MSRRRMSQEELKRAGRRLRELRVRADLTQAELAGDRFSHAYISVLEAGRREPSREAVEYFAQRLGVPVEQVWGEKGASWALELAADLRREGLTSESRNLLEKTLSNLERDSEVHPRVVVALHRELAAMDFDERPESAEAHLLKALALANGDRTLMVERGEAAASLAELLLRRGDRDRALEQFRASASLLLGAVNRSRVVTTASATPGALSGVSQ